MEDVFYTSTYHHQELYLIKHKGKHYRLNSCSAPLLWGNNENEVWLLLKYMWKSQFSFQWPFIQYQQKFGGGGGEVSLGRRSQEDSQYESICLQEHLLHILRPCFPRSSWTSLADRKWKVIIFSFYFHTTFAFFLNKLLWLFFFFPSSVPFPTLPPSASPTLVSRGGGRGSVWYLASYQC